MFINVVKGLANWRKVLADGCPVYVRRTGLVTLKYKDDISRVCVLPSYFVKPERSNVHIALATTTSMVAVVPWTIYFTRSFTVIYQNLLNYYSSIQIGIVFIAYKEIKYRGK